MQRGNFVRKLRGSTVFAGLAFLFYVFMSFFFCWKIYGVRVSYCSRYSHCMTNCLISSSVQKFITFIQRSNRNSLGLGRVANSLSAN